MPKKNNGKKKTRKKLLESFHEVGKFCCGLARVRLDDKEFHILPNGKPAYPERYKSVADFEDGLAWVEDFDGSRFQINEEGIKQD